MIDFLIALFVTAGIGAGLGYWWGGVQEKRGNVTAPLTWPITGACIGVMMVLLGGIGGALGVPKWLSMGLGVVAGVFAARWFFNRQGWNTGKQKRTELGSSDFGTVADAEHKGHLTPVDEIPENFMLGHFDPAETPDHHPYFGHSGHVITCAPTRSGKGIGAVIPNLLYYPGSALVLDIKGENYAITARRRREMGQKVYVIDPFGVTGEKAHGFNWLDCLDPCDKEIVSESAALTDLLVISDKEGDHWDESAKDLIRGVLVWLAVQGADRANMGELRRVLTRSWDDLKSELNLMAASEKGFEVPARAANAILSLEDKERSSVLSTARRHTAFLDDPSVAECLGRSDFDLTDIKDDEMTVYIVMPPSKLKAYNRLMRGFIGLALSAITRNDRTPKHKVAFFLDEFAQLGKMAAIENAVGLVSGYGMVFWIFIQDVSQIKGVYSKWQSFFANSAKVFFGTADFDTAKYVSDNLGTTTADYQTYGTSDGGKGSASTSQQLQARALLTPDEVMRLGPERPLVLISGERPYMLHRMNYLTDANFSEFADPNPYHL